MSPHILTGDFTGSLQIQWRFPQLPTDCWENISSSSCTKWNLIKDPLYYITLRLLMVLASFQECLLEVKTAFPFIPDLFSFIHTRIILSVLPLMVWDHLYYPPITLALVSFIHLEKVGILLILLCSLVLSEFLYEAQVLQRNPIKTHRLYYFTSLRYIS